MAEHNGWVMKNKWGSLLIWTAGYLKRDVIEKIGKEQYREWKRLGHKIVKAKLTEVK